MRGTHFARHDELQPGVERTGDLRTPGEARVFEDEHAALGLLGGDVLGRFEQGRAHIGVAPLIGHADERGLGRNERLEPRPQRRQVLRLDTLVVGLALGRATAHDLFSSVNSEVGLRLGRSSGEGGMALAMGIDDDRHRLIRG